MQKNKIDLISFFSFLFVLPVIYFVATRESWVGTDTQNYIFFFQKSKFCGCIPEEMEFLFGFVAWVVSGLGGSEESFFGVISALQFFLSILLAKSLSHYLEYGESTFTFRIFFLAILIIFPFFLSMQANVLRQGVSALFVANSAVFFKQKKKMLLGLFLIFGIGFHYSALMYAAVMPLLSVSYKKIRLIFICLVLSYVSGLSEQVVRFFSDVLGLPLYQFVSDYGSDSDYQAGIRLDFVAFTIFPWVLLFFSDRIQSTEVVKSRMQKIASIYLVLAFPFLIFGWASYSDRYALGAWLLIPVFGTLILIRFFSTRYQWIAPYCVFGAICIFISQINSSHLWQ